MARPPSAGITGRIFALCLGAGALAWVGATAARTPDFGELSDFADRLSLGDTFDLSTLERRADRSMAQVPETCSARYLTAAMIVAARALETSIAEADVDDIDRRLANMRTTAARAVGCSPNHAFGWLGLAWTAIVEGTRDDTTSRLLARSYAMAPHETWIALRRHLIVMPLWSDLPAGLQASAVDEFLDLIRAMQLDFAARSFVTAPQRFQDAIAQRLRTLPELQRAGFARRVSLLGIDIAAPGVPAPRRDPRR